LQWLNELDRQFELTNSEYGMGDFIDDLKDKGYIDENKQTGEIKITPKTEQGIRKKSLEEIFGKLKKTKSGDHQTFKPGMGDEISPESRPFQFGDMLEQIDFTESRKWVRRGDNVNDEHIHREDLIDEGARGAVRHAGGTARHNAPLAAAPKGAAAAPHTQSCPG